MPEPDGDLQPVAVARFDLRAGTLRREGIFDSLTATKRHIRAVADAAGLLLSDSVQVDRDGLGSVSLLDSTGQPAIEFHLVNQVSNKVAPNEGVAVFSISTGDDGRVERVTACGVYGSHTETLEAEEFAWSFIKGSEGMRYVGLTIPFSHGVKSRFGSVEKTG